MMRPFGYFWPTLAACLLLVCENGKAQDSQVPVVDLGYAKYQGAYNESRDVTGYFGMRYAAPPTGKLLRTFLDSLVYLTVYTGDQRWRAPQPPANDTSGTVIQANVDGPQCFQAASGTSPTNPYRENDNQKRLAPAAANSEDCLFVKYVSLPQEI
jgi:hypothetical protein